MLRTISIFAGAVLLVGCATHPRSAAYQPAPDEEAVAASALVFDPPLVRDEPPLLLARQPRQPSAVVGYDEVQTTFFYLRMDDRQFIDSPRDWSLRRAITTRVGVSHR
jgi:hypothetical protein